MRGPLASSSSTPTRAGTGSTTSENTTGSHWPSRTATGPRTDGARRPAQPSYARRFEHTHATHFTQTLHCHRWDHDKVSESHASASDPELVTHSEAYLSSAPREQTGDLVEAMPSAQPRPRTRGKKGTRAQPGGPPIESGSGAQLRSRSLRGWTSIDVRR